MNQSARFSGLHAMLLMFACAFPVSATTITNSPSKDNTIYETSGSTNYLSNGAGDTLTAGRIDLNNGGGWRRRSLIAFTNLHNVIPAGATINSATLRLFCSKTTGGAFPVSVHRLTRDWGEGTANVNGGEGKGTTATTGDATWYLRFAPTSSTVWTAPGGDYISPARATTTVSAEGAFYTWSSANLAADVQLWANTPSTNFGWIILGDEASYHTTKQFASRENKTTANRPVLIVDYTTSVPVGACNFTNGTCSQLTSNQCVALGGTWAGAGTVCPPPTGACCLPSGLCTNTTATNCTALGGTYQGDGVACVSNLCPVILTPFVDPLPIPAIATPVNGTIGGAATYDIHMLQFTNKAHRDLPPTIFWGYDGATPGPVIVASNSAPVTVRFFNDLRDANGNYRTNHYLPVDTCLDGADVHGALPRAVIHLHGGHVPPESDGYPENTILPGQSQTNLYPNLQPASMIWFHDHALGITRLNVYMGLAGGYVIRDAAEAALGLPTGEYEVPLIIQDRKFNPDGSLSYPATWQQDFFGDKIMVNGKVWPYHDVKRGKYRFRLLNGCNSRTLALGFSNGMNFQQIGTDGGLLPAPVTTNVIYLGPGERADTIVDFQGQSVGAQITLTNGAPAPFPGTPGVGLIADVMQFAVVVGSAFTDPVPGTLVPVPPLSTNDAVAERSLELYKTNDPCTGERWTINGGGWHSAIAETPRFGDTEIWSFINKSGMSHPMHLHLVLFQVLDRQPFVMSNNVPVPTGPRVPPGPNEAGWKDTVQTMPYEITRVIARFDGYTGVYPYHCHILEHEDNDMMRRFEVLPPLPPVIICASNQTVECGSPWAFTSPTASSTCGTNTVSVLSTVTNAVCGNTFTATRTWRVTDSCGGTNDCSQTVTIVDATPPVITCAGNKTNECTAPWTFDEPTAGDTCGTNVVTILNTVTNTAGHCGNTYTATRTWQATDACGNTATCSQTVYVTDTTPPVITCASNKAVESGQAWTFDDPLTTDTCGTNSITVVSTITNSPSATTNLITRTWQATDACGNSAQCSQTVAIYGLPPSITTHPQSQSVTVGSNVTLFTVAAGTSPLAHQWRFGTSPLPGETATNLTLLNFQWANVGGYDVVVTNDFGSTTSSVAILGILYPESELTYAWSSNWLTLQWLGTNWQLQGSGNLGSWFAYLDTPSLFGPTNTLLVPTTNTGQFFRLLRD